jgi:hypothetical protein
MNATVTHFTAWLAVDSTVLLSDNCDVTILQDEAIAYRTDDDGVEIPEWTTAPGVPQAFYAETAATTDDDHREAQDQARDLMEQAGWRIVGDWDATDTGYIVTVERV